MPKSFYEAPGRLNNFMVGFVAATQLAQRAGESAFFIEFIVLMASLIDGLLRIGLILKHQLETKTNEVVKDLIFQSDEDKIISERQIYLMARNKEIITEDVYSRLNTLFTQRNRVVHRYIISDISTKDVLEIGIRYEEIRDLIIDAVEKLEKEQIAIGVGMTRHIPEVSKSDLLRNIDKMSKIKHSSPALDQALKKKAN